MVGLFKSVGGHALLIIVSLLTVGCDENNIYRYTAYDNNHDLVVSGWFTLDESDSTSISGEWSFTGDENDTDFGPQIGSGNFIGGRESTAIWINLNPEWADNNVFLQGVQDGNSITGDWIFVGFPGEINRGRFNAVK